MLTGHASAAAAVLVSSRSRHVGETEAVAFAKTWTQARPQERLRKSIKSHALQCTKWNAETLVFSRVPQACTSDVAEPKNLKNFIRKHSLSFDC